MDSATCAAVEWDPEKVSGSWVFRGTRVPVVALFENLEGGVSVDDFLSWFLGVAKGQTEAVLEHIVQSLHQGRPAAWRRGEPRDTAGMTQATAYEHIVIDEAGVPLIEGTTTKVVELVLDVLAYGWSPDELHFQHPHLTLGQIHSALAYYWDHQEELDGDIKRRLERVERIRRDVGPSQLVERLKAKGLLP